MTPSFHSLSLEQLMLTVFGGHVFLNFARQYQFQVSFPLSGVSFPYVPLLGCETWEPTHRGYIYFKLKIKGRHASIYLANGSALVEFRIWEEKKDGY